MHRTCIEAQTAADALFLIDGVAAVLLARNCINGTGGNAITASGTFRVDINLGPKFNQIDKTV
jgi:hypothetical protein